MHTHESVISCVTYRSPHYCFSVLFAFNVLRPLSVYAEGVWHEPRRRRVRKGDINSLLPGSNISEIVVQTKGFKSLYYQYDEDRLT